jgi:hypothetical protein
MEHFERDELDDSEEDTVTDYSQMNTATNDVNNIDSTDFVLRTMPSSTLVPTISVTPHSAAGKNYPVLGYYFEIIQLFKIQFVLFIQIYTFLQRKIYNNCMKYTRSYNKCVILPR